jgi:AraC-like DNA-binding protein
LRNDAVHRLLGGAGSAHTLGAGFLLKPGVSGFHYDWTPDHYAGVLVLRGSGRYRDWRGREHELAPGSFFQRLPGRRHTTVHVPDGTWAECFVRFGARIFSELARLGVLDAARVVLEPGRPASLLQRFEAVLGDMRDPAEVGVHRAIAGMQALLIEVYELDRRQLSPATDRELVAAARRRLSTDVHRRLDLPSLAEELGCGYERFRKLFRDRVGVSPGEFRIRRRIERACSLLSGGARSVKEVAYELGYPDAFTFSRQFRKVMGVPPSSLRG